MSLPGHGETVGTAYIRILADGSGLRSDIEREWAKHRGEMEELGEEDGQAYEDARAKTQQRLFQRHLQDEIKQNRAANNRRNSIFRNSLKQQIDDYRKMRQQQQKIDNDTTLRSLANQARQLRQQEKDFTEFERLMQRRYDTLSRLSEGFAHRDRDNIRKVYDELTHSMRMGDVTGQAEIQFRRLRKATNELIHDGEHGFLRFDNRLRDGVRSASDLERSLRRVDDRIGRLNIGRLFGKGSRNDFLNALGSLVGGLAEVSARAVPRFINSFVGFGVSLRQARRDGDLLRFGLGTLAGVFPKLIAGTAGLFVGLNAIQLIAGPLAAAISLLAGGITALASTIVFGLAGGIGATLPLLGVFGVGIAVLTVALGNLNAAQKKVLTTRLKPVIDDFKVLRNETRGALFSDLKQQVPLLDRLLNRDIGPLFVAAAKGISKSWTSALQVFNGSAMAKNFAAFRTFIPGAIQRLGKIFTNVFVGMSGVMRALVPVANRFLDALVAGTERFSKFANSRLGQNKLSVWFTNAYDSGRRLWRTVKDLVKILFDLFNVGRITGDSLFDSLNKRLEQFDRFLRSEQGRASLTRWFQQSASMLSHLGHALGGIFDLFSTLAGGGSGALNTILDVIGKIAEIIKENLPVIQRFQQAFFGALGRVADALFRALAPLRPVLTDLLGIFGGVLADLARATASVLVPALNALAKVTQFIGDHADAFKPFIIALGLFWGAWKAYTIMSTALTALKVFVAGAEAQFARLRALSLAKGAGAVGLFGLLGGGLASNAVAGHTGNDLLGNLETLGAGTLGGAATGAAAGSIVPGVGTVIGTAVGAAAGTISGLISVFGKMKKSAQDSSKAAAAALEAQDAAAKQLAQTLSSVNDTYGKMFQQSVLKGLADSGVLDLAQKAGLNLADVGKAVTGALPTAQLTKFTTALDLANASGKISNTEYNKLHDALLAAGIGAADAEDHTNQLKEALGETRVPVEKLGVSYKKLKSVLKDTGTTLDERTASGKFNNEVIKENVLNVNKMAAANLAAHRPLAQVSQDWLAQVGSLQKNLTALGFNADGVEKLIGKYGRVPHSVATYLLEHGGQLLDNRLRGILEKYANWPKNKSTTVAVKDLSIAKMNAILRKQLEIKNKRFVIDADTSAAISKLNQLKLIAQQGGTFIVQGSGIHGMASGGILTRPTWLGPNVFGGEAGREAVVPLQRPLSQVDPSVRALSAFAQGLEGAQGLARGGVIGGGRSINVAEGAITVVTPTTDPAAVAEEMLMRLVAKGY